MSLRLSATNLSKSYGEFRALNGVTIDFAPGHIHAVLGENGAGKSTLMKMLFGILQPTEGEIRLNDQPVQWRSSHEAIRRGIGMVQQHFTLVESLSVIDNIMLGAEVCDSLGRLKRDAAARKMQALLPSESLRLDWQREVSSLSVGEKQKVEILKLLYRRSEILILDEPTAVLAPQEIEELFQVLRQLRDAGRTMILITHKINEVLQVCDRYHVLRHGRLVDQGPVTATASAAIVKSMMGRELPTLPESRVASGESVALEAHDLRVGSRLRGVSLRAHHGEIVGIAGVEGAGQSELVDALMGLTGFTGRAEILAVPTRRTQALREAGVCLIPEDRLVQGLWLQESCFVNLALGLEQRFCVGQAVQWSKWHAATAEWAKEFDVRAADLSVSVGHLSGGNQQKIIFARETIGRQARFLIGHQPTRGVDLGAAQRIHQRLLELRNQGIGQLILSSDLEELCKLCDRIYVLFAGQISGHFKRGEFTLGKLGAAMTGTSHAL